jgi:hypothetical protein
MRCSHHDILEYLRKIPASVRANFFGENAFKALNPCILEYRAHKINEIIKTAQAILLEALGMVLRLFG